MSKSAKIERTQKLFLKAMKEKFAEDPTIPTTQPIQRVPIQSKDCPFCKGYGYRKKGFCHHCGGSGKVRVP